MEGEKQGREEKLFLFNFGCLIKKLKIKSWILVSVIIYGDHSFHFLSFNFHYVWRETTERKKGKLQRERIEENREKGNGRFRISYLMYSNFLSLARIQEVKGYVQKVWRNELQIQLFSLKQKSFLELWGERREST